MTFDPHDRFTFDPHDRFINRAGQRSYVKLLRGRREEPGNEANNDHVMCYDLTHDCVYSCECVFRPLICSMCLPAGMAVCGSGVPTTSLPHYI